VNECLKVAKTHTGFVEYLEEEKWKNAPEALRPRPKYYYYFEWMKDRIFEHYPELPEPVMDKVRYAVSALPRLWVGCTIDSDPPVGVRMEQLLATDAAELDLLLQYPQAIKGQVEEYLGVFREKGGQYLQVRTPMCFFGLLFLLILASFLPHKQWNVSFSLVLAGSGCATLGSPHRGARQTRVLSEQSQFSSSSSALTSTWCLADVPHAYAVVGRGEGHEGRGHHRAGAGLQRARRGPPSSANTHIPFSAALFSLVSTCVGWQKRVVARLRCE